MSDGEPIGKCPKCGKDVVELKGLYTCQSGKENCGFVIWKSMVGKAITKTQAKKLLKNKKSDLIKGFTSKAGNEFDAYLVIKNDGGVGFEFAEKKEKGMDNK